MKISLFLLLIIFEVYTGLLFAQKIEWQPIKPVSSNLDDVEKLLGKPESVLAFDDGSRSYFYYLKDYNLEIHFSGGACKKAYNRSWSFQKDTVVSITYIWGNRTNFRLSSLKVDHKKFTKKYFQGDTPGHFKYFNDEQGIEYHGEHNRIYDVMLYPSSGYDERRCDNVMKAENE
jgi:hypothetical protein